MPDAADRIRVEPRVGRAAPMRGKNYVRALMPSSKRSVAAAALVAMMICIVVNAVALQHGRRIDLGPDPSAVASTSPPSPAATHVPMPVAAQPALAPRPAPNVVALAHPQKSGDAIADFLRTQTTSDKRRLTLTAQGALAKLGFVVKVSGTLDAETRTALADFEKSHHMPVSTELTAKFVKTLTAAAAAE